MRACKLATRVHTSEAAGLWKAAALDVEVIEDDVLELIEAAHRAAAVVFLHATNDQLKKLRPRKIRPRE